MHTDARGCWSLVAASQRVRAGAADVEYADGGLDAERVDRRSLPEDSAGAGRRQHGRREGERRRRWPPPPPSLGAPAMKIDTAAVQLASATEIDDARTKFGDAERGDRRLHGRPQAEGARRGARGLLPDGAEAVAPEGRGNREPVLRQRDADLRQLAVKISFTKHTLANGLDVLLHEDRGVSDRRGQPLVSRRIEERAAGQDRLRAPLRAPDVRRVAASRPRLLPAAAGRRRHAQRIDQRRSHQLLGGGAGGRARARAVDGIRSHGVSAAGADRGEVLEPARRRAERAAAELREPPLRAGADGAAGGAVPPGSSVSLDDDRRDRGPAGGAARRGARLLPPLLPSGERLDCARGRHRQRRRAGAGRPRISARSTAGDAGRSGRARRRRCRATCASTSRIGSSCRVSTSPG